MAYTYIEWFALTIAVLGLIKIIVLFISPESWFNFAKKVWKKPNLVAIISLILSAVVLYYLLQSMTIVQIFAVMLLTSLLLAVGMAPFVNDFLKINKKRMKNKLKESWLYILIWLVLILWVLKEVLI